MSCWTVDLTLAAAKPLGARLDGVEACGMKHALPNAGANPAAPTKLTDSVPAESRDTLDAGSVAISTVGLARAVHSAMRHGSGAGGDYGTQRRGQGSRPGRSEEAGSIPAQPAKLWPSVESLSQ